MIRNIKTSAASIICSGILVAALGGCSASHQEKLPASRSRDHRQDTAFAAGAGRAPTAETTYSFAKILIAQGRERDGLYVLSKVMREHPKFIPAYNEMASIYVRSDRVDDAIVVIEAALEQAPNDAVLHNNMGMCHLLQTEHEKALQSFTRATEIMPANPTFRSNRAAALALCGHEGEAEREYQTVLGKTATKQNLGILGRVRGNKPAEPTVEPQPAAVADEPAPSVDASDLQDPGMEEAAACDSYECPDHS